MNMPAVGPYHSPLLSSINTLTLHHKSVRYLMRLSMLKSKSYTGLKGHQCCTRPGMQLLAEGGSSDNEEPLYGGY